MTQFKKLTKWIAAVKVWAGAGVVIIVLGAAVSAAGWRPVLKFEFDARFVDVSKAFLQIKCDNIRVLIAINNNARTNSNRERRQNKATASRVPSALSRPDISPALAREIEKLEGQRNKLLILEAKYCVDGDI